MEIICEKELVSINGGATLNLTSAVLSAINSGVKIVLEVGRSLGSALRRSASGKSCSV